MTNKHTIYHGRDSGIRTIDSVLESCENDIGFCQQEIRTIEQEVSDQIREKYTADIPTGEIGIAMIPSPLEWRAGDKTIETIFQSEKTLDDILPDGHPAHPDN